MSTGNRFLWRDRTLGNGGFSFERPERRDPSLRQMCFHHSLGSFTKPLAQRMLPRVRVFPPMLRVRRTCRGSPLPSELFFVVSCLFAPSLSPVLFLFLPMVYFVSFRLQPPRDPAV
jgi:hypothetical protein